MDHDFDDDDLPTFPKGSGKNELRRKIEEFGDDDFDEPPPNFSSTKSTSLYNDDDFEAPPVVVSKKSSSRSVHNDFEAPLRVKKSSSRSVHDDDFEAPTVVESCKKSSSRTIPDDFGDIPDYAPISEKKQKNPKKAKVDPKFDEFEDFLVPEKSVTTQKNVRESPHKSELVGEAIYEDIIENKRLRKRIDELEKSNTNLKEMRRKDKEELKKVETTMKENQESSDMVIEGLRSQLVREKRKYGNNTQAKGGYYTVVIIAMLMVIIAIQAVR